MDKSDQKSEHARPQLSPSIYLDYGADAHECGGEEFEICERGMHFSSRWQFALGTQLAVSFSYQDPDGRITRTDMEGIIVDCEQIACKCYRTTLLFLEVPEPLLAVIEDTDRKLEVNVGNEKKLRAASGLN